MRGLGRGAGARVRLKVTEILDMEGSGLFPPGTGGMALAAAGGGDEVLLDIEAVRPMSEPVSGAEPDAPPFKAIKAERLDDRAAVDELLGEGEADKMHVVGKRADSRAQRQARAAANPRPSGARTPLAEHIPPPGDEFVQWFDSLTLDELDQMLRDLNSGGRTGAREIIADHIRHPGHLHEWVMVKHARQAKVWGVSMRTVLDARTRTALTVGKNFKHGGDGSGTMHLELDAMIADAETFLDFKKRLNVWADEELFAVRGPYGEPPLGRYYLPKDLQVRAEGGGRR
jgi:hypothetical protein